jgi:hypothetical protein
MGAQVTCIIVSVLDRAAGEDVYGEQYVVGSVMGTEQRHNKHNGSPRQAKGLKEGAILRIFRQVQSESASIQETK